MYFSLKRKRQLEFVGEVAQKDVPPLPEFPEDMLDENREMESSRAKKARHEQGAKYFHTLNCSDIEQFRVESHRFR